MMHLGWHRRQRHLRRQLPRGESVDVAIGKRLGERRGFLVGALGLDGGVDVEGVNELHETIEVILLGDDGARVDEMDEGLDETRLHLGQNDGDFVDAVKRTRLEEKLEERRRRGQEHLMRPDDAVLAKDGEVDVVLRVA